VACATLVQLMRLARAGRTGAPRRILDEPARSSLAPRSQAAASSMVRRPRIRGLRPTIELLRRKSPRLRRQLEDSLAGIVQNVCEGSGRTGGDRPALYRCALGSLREVNGILLAAVAFGWLAEAPLAAERDRLGGILFGLQRR
jgi:hypothetical protein